MFQRFVSLAVCFNWQAPKLEHQIQNLSYIEIDLASVANTASLEEISISRAQYVLGLSDNFNCSTPYQPANGMWDRFIEIQASGS